VTLARSQAEDLRASRARVTRAFDAARRGIERDLHDGAQQGLLALSVRLSRLADRVPPQLREEVASLQGLSRGTLVDLRRLASGTYPSALRELGVAAALREAIGPEVTVSDRLEHRPSEETEAALYFAALEAVTNARKHAKAGTIDVILDRAADGAYYFRVDDDGVGMDTATGGTGLAGIADRLGARGGTLTVESTCGRGTTVTGTAYEDPR
jgi:signal transduction histidine kinase